MYSKFGQPKWIFVCQMLKWPAAISSTDWLHIQSDHMHCIWYQEAHELEGARVHIVQGSQGACLHGFANCG